MERGYSQHTVRSYKRDLWEFSEFLSRYDENIGLKEADKPSIQFFLQKLTEGGLSARTIARKLATLKSFYKFLLADEKITNNPAASVKTPKVPQSIPGFLQKKEIQALMELPELSTSKGIRDRLILELFYSTGMRISELVKIKMKDVQLENRIIRILGKGNKERLVILGEKASDAMRMYLSNQRKNKDFKEIIFLFPRLRKSRKTTSEGHIHQKTVYNIVKGYLCKVSGDEKLSPHSLRHTFATHMLDSGADLMSVKDLLGHKSLSSTQVYTHVQIEKLIKVYKKSHPHAKK